MNLSEDQETIRVAPIDCHIKVLASPGSGKSTVACHRVSYLINECGFRSDEILATMFNSDAVDEFKEGLDELDVYPMPPVRTYHKLAKKILESLAKHNIGDNIPLETSSSFTHRLIFDAMKVTKETFPEINIFDHQLKEVVEAFIGRVKGAMNTPEECYEAYFQDENVALVTIYQNFEILREKARVRTFDDLIKDAVVLLESNEAAYKAVANKFKAIIVDEYQDINEISHRLIKSIAGERAWLTVVGDDDQTINEWRGAKPEYLISEFDKDFPSPKVFYLDRTFRYGHTVSLLANSLIKHNKVRVDKLCVSAENSHHTRVRYKEYPSDLEVPYYCHKQTAIVDEIKEHIDRGGSYNDVGILLRVYSLSPFIEMALLANKIPYTLDGNKSVLECDEYHSLIGLLCYAYYKDAPLKQKYTWVNKALRLPRLPIKEDLYKKLVEAVVLGKGEVHVRKLCKSLSRYSYKQTINRVKSLLFVNEREWDCALDVIKCFEDKSNLLQSMTMLDDMEKSARIDALISSFKSIFCLEGYSIVDALKAYRALVTLIKSNRDGVQILSVHKSKGLAWPVVIVPGLAEGVFPYQKKDAYMNVESERRLFFVAITRVRKYLLLLGPKDGGFENIAKSFKSRPLGPYHQLPSNVSRFMYECDFYLNQIVGLSIHGNNEGLKQIRGHKLRHYYNEYLSKIKSNIRL